MASVARKLVEICRKGTLFMVSLNRPEKRNCVNQAMAQQLFAAFHQFETDANSSVLILHGAGGSFCAGYDLGELSSSKDSQELRLPGPIGQGLAPMGPSRLCLSKPSIAAVSGYAVAGGLELALLCDLRVMEESAVMGVYCRRFGVPLIDGGTVRLPKLIGLSRALDLILTGRSVSAQEALQIGLANRVCADGFALDEAVKLGEMISGFPQGCMRADRRSAYHSVYEAKSLSEALQFEFDNGIKVVTEESVPGAAKFIKDGKGRHGSFSEFNSNSKM